MVRSLVKARTSRYLSSKCNQRRALECLCGVLGRKNQKTKVYGRATLLTDNLIIYNLDVDNASVYGVKYVGGLAGYLQYSTVYNVNISGLVSASDADVGGFSGVIYDGEFNKSGFNGVVIQSGADYTGGFTGQLMIANVNDCFANVSVTSTNNYVGGFAGEIVGNSVVNNSYATGNVSGVSFVGGFGGSARNAIVWIDNSYFMGNVSGTANYLGGFLGRNANALNVINAFAFNECDTSYISI